jgi:hypothetical protein
MAFETVIKVTLTHDCRHAYECSKNTLISSTVCLTLLLAGVVPILQNTFSS